MNKQSRIYVAGHRGLVGRAIVRKLREYGYLNLILRDRESLDLCDRVSVENFFRDEKPEYVFVAAAKVGGILANSTYPADFIYENLLIETNIIGAAHKFQVEKLLFLGSSCIYPKFAPQPIQERSLLTGELEVTNRAYAIAKIAGLELCKSFYEQYGDNFLSVMPTNLYGPYDNFDPVSSHVLPGILGRMHQAKSEGISHVQLWGTGSPRREFLHVDDLAEALVFLMERFGAADIEGLVNVGVGHDITIAELAHVVKEIVGFEGDITFDPSKPDGTPRKVLDVSKMKSLGWEASIPLYDGIRQTYNWALARNIF